jgi:hypothetical protein
MISIKNQRITVETATLVARIEKGFITSLKSRAGNEEFITPFDLAQAAAIQLVFRNEECARIDESKFGEISCHQVSDTRAEIRFHSWDGDAVLAVAEDPASGDLLIEPAAYSSRSGARAVRWTLKGIRRDLKLAAPLFQGVKVKLNDGLLKNTVNRWPHFWEAGLAVLEGAGSGFWVHTQDTRYRYKALRTGDAHDPYSLGFDTESYGPLDNSLGSGGLVWRINVFQGDWQVPAGRYRNWLWQAYGLDKEEAVRQPWLEGLSMAISWCPTDTGLLETLAKRVDPGKVLLHLPNWRTDGYDENYPDFNASPRARAFIKKCHTLGFHVAPHCNSVDMDPTHPYHTFLRDFQYRNAENQLIDGWSWYNGRVIGVANSNAALMRHRDKKQMVKIHPGLTMWRHLLGQKILAAARAHSLETVFIDVTLCTWNLHNCLVENATPTEGMLELIRHIARLGNGLAVGGEGRNEITMQALSFAQAHLYKSWQTSFPGLARAGGCPMNEFLFGRLCRTIGYSGLAGKTPDQEMRMRVHESLGAIPTLTIRSADEIRRPNRAVRRVLEGAA